MSTKLTLFVGGYSRSGLADPFGDIGGAVKNYPEGAVNTNVVQGKGIYLFDVSAELTFSIHGASPVAGPAEPSFFNIDVENKRIYVANECDQFDGHQGGAITAFRFDSENVALINSVPAGGQHPCMIASDKTGKFICCANYSSGDISIWRLREDGGLGERTSFIRFEGSGPTSRQTSPHAHSALFTPSNKHILIADLGTDKIHRLSFDETSGAATLVDGGASVTPGSGPRSFALHPNNKWLYLTNEMESRLDIFHLRESDETLELLGSANMLPTGWPKEPESGQRWAQFNGGKWAAHTSVSPDGKFVYASNRLHDSIAVFKVTENGTVEIVGHCSSHGAVPRHFSISPDGNKLFVANQVSSNVAAFNIDRESGMPQFVRSVIVPFPSFVQAVGI
eukprot:c23389_g1_i1.p1 GENE.c23389_g1_i1~~c23389_g1_i1.p1  ORF type:complete len:409 (+),score=92.58 c23389_g1_i1:46-1227(+)